MSGTLLQIREFPKSQVHFTAETEKNKKRIDSPYVSQLLISSTTTDDCGKEFSFRGRGEKTKPTASGAD